MSFVKYSLTAAAFGASVLGAAAADAGKAEGVGDARSVEVEPASGDGDGWVVVRGQVAEAQIAPACVEPDPPPPLQAPAAAGAGCFSDRFFVDLPAEAGAMPDGYTLELYDQLDGMKADVLDWVCPDNDPGCHDPSNPLPLAVHEVLDANRAWSVQFTSPVRDDKLCLAVTGLRNAAYEAKKVLQPAGPMPLVGRECAMRIMGGAQSQPSADMLQWHLRKLGVQPGGGGEPGPPVPVVVLDTGIRAEVGVPLGVRVMVDSLAVGGADPMATIHPHGTHMAVLIDQVSPNAHIHDLRVLDENGHGAIADLAAGLEQVAQSDWFEEGPLIVNMSLGWAPELSRPRRLEGAGCTVQEDPVGESVRWALSLLADRGETLPTLVVAAAGNRPHRAALVDELYADLFAVDRDVAGLLPPRSSCNSAPAAPSPDWFYPAEWNRRPTCDDQGNDPRYLVWAVGATDSRELPGALTVDNAETPVVAPGEHVYVDFPYSDPLPPDDCGGDGYPNRLTLPAAVTGSSAAAALTSAVAAEAQSRLIKNVEPTLSGPAMQRLIWLTGDDIAGFGGWVRDPWRPDPMSGHPVGLARLSWCGVFHAVEQGTVGSDPDCEALLACAEPAALPAAIIDGDLEATCRAAADACLASAVCNPPQEVRIGWPANYTAPATCLAPFACPSAWSSASPCEATGVGCGYERTIEQHSAAPVGPQPGTMGCPDCAFDIAGTLFGEINPAFAPGTTLTYPYIVVDYYPTGSWTSEREWVAVPQGGAWQPGDYVKVSNLPPLPAGTGHKLSLWTYVDPPGTGNATSDLSPLRLE